MTTPGGSYARSRWRAWRIRRAQDRLEDARHHLRFFHYPSDVRRQQRRITKAQVRLDRLRRKDREGSS